ncbi:hypothetical protein V5F77_28035 [Xanthobacter sp. DSM 24535]|uniref:hypothetical protein n=1 Tax=Roseixanthobacter psychrophilus TaxID=3119917 RepID=UPI003729B39B
MKNPPLSESLATLRDQFKPYESAGMQLHAVAVQTLIFMMSAMVDRARDLERDLAQMDEVARDLDAVGRTRAETLAVPVAGSNVVILFRPSDQHHSGGGDAA